MSRLITLLEEYLEEYNLNNTNSLNLGAWARGCCNETDSVPDPTLIMTWARGQWHTVRHVTVLCGATQTASWSSTQKSGLA